MFDVWEQEEWHGMVREGLDRRDPYSSILEYNTRPGSNRLERVVARKDYLGQQMPAMAWKNNDWGMRWKLKGSGGTGIKDITYSTTTIKYQVCFELPDPREVPYASQGYWLFGCRSDSARAWGLEAYLNGSDNNWYLVLYHSATAENYITFYATAGAGWYWLFADYDQTSTGQSLTWSLQNSKMTTFTDSLTTTEAWAMPSADYFLTIGGGVNGEAPAYKCSIAYAGVGASTEYYSAWVAVPAIAGETPLDYTFMPMDPRWTVQPACLNDTARSTWVLEPRPFSIETASTVSPFAATGLRVGCGNGIRVNLADKELFQDQTIFMFAAKWYDHMTWLRSYDSQLVIQSQATAAGARELLVLYPPADLNQASGSWGRRKTATSTATALALGTAEWFAVEFNPTIQSGESNVDMYRWTGSTWSTFLSGASVGLGIDTIDTTELVIAESWGREAELYDFRVVVGDSGWKTTHNATSLTQLMPGGLLTWLELGVESPTGARRWPRDDNVGYCRLSGDADLPSTARTIAVTDRVDGTYRYTVDPFGPQGAWTGCGSVRNAILPDVQDLFQNASGTVSGLTDAYFFDGVDPIASLVPLTRGKRQAALVGSLRYGVGPGPLQVVAGKRPRPVGFGRPWCNGEMRAATEAASTFDYLGSLDHTTAYKWSVTLYDPATGIESNAFGPFQFVTGSATTTATACSFQVQAEFRTTQYLGGCEARFYRFSDSTGVYYLEDAGKIGDLVRQVVGGVSLYSSWKAYGTFKLPDADLTLRQPLTIDNTSPPLHSVSTIWGGRAWFVDALNQSRIWFSKIGQAGAVPGQNLLWTDEGIGGDILGLMPGFGGLLLLRERSIWIIPQFADEAAAYAQPLIPDVGCVSGAAAVYAEGILWWAAPNGIHSWDTQSTPVNWSQKLDRLDRKIWDHAPDHLFSYYDKTNFRVVFGCDGSGIAFHVKNGSASLISVPESCSTEVMSSAYSGPLLGCAGSVFQEWEHHNADLTLSSAGSMYRDNLGPVSAANFTALTWYWCDGREIETGSRVCGYEELGGYTAGFKAALQTAYWMLTPTSAVGRGFTSIASDWEDAWTRQISSVVRGSAGNVYFLVRTEQALLDNCYLARTPCYYESQDMYLGGQTGLARRDSRVYGQLDLVAGERVVGSATADIAFLARQTASTADVSISARADLINEKDYILSLRTRGNQCHYTYLSSAPADLPEISALRIHYQRIRPRGRTR